MAKRDLQKRIDLPGATLTSSAIRVSGGGGGGGMAAHALFGPYHTGELDRTQATWVATDIATAIATHTAIEDAHHAKQHSITDAAHHTATGAQYSVIGLSALNTLGVLPSASDVSAAAHTLLRSDSLGGIAVAKVRTPAIDTASGGLSIAPASGTTTITGTTVVTVGVQTPLITTASNVDLVIDAGGTGSVKFPNAQTLRTSTFDSGVPLIKGWQINEVTSGSEYSALTIGKIKANELTVDIFVANETRVDRGDQLWTKSYGILYADFTTPGSLGGTVSITFEDSPAITGAIFTNNDWLLLRKLDINTGFSLFNVWGQVASYTNNSNGSQTWTFTLRQGPTSKLIPKGSLGIDFGASGAAFIHLSVLDAAGAPYIKMRKWAGSDPYTAANYTTYVQIGNLGSLGNQYYSSPSGSHGLYIRSVAYEDQFMVADDNGFQIRGASFGLWNSTTQTILMNNASGINVREDVWGSWDNRRALQWWPDVASMGGSPSLSIYTGKVVGGLTSNQNFSYIDARPTGNVLAGLSLAAFGQGTGTSAVVYLEGGSQALSTTPSVTITATTINLAGNTDVSGNIAVSGTIDGVDLSTFKAAYDSHNHNSAYLALSGGTLTGTLNGRDFIPSADNTYDIGSATYRVQDLYAVNLHVNNVVGAPSYSHEHAASDITSGTLAFARIPTTWPGALNLDADAAGASNYLRWTTQTGAKNWDLLARAHDYATTPSQQNDLLLTYFDGTTAYIAFQADSATRVVDFAQTPTVGGTTVSLSTHNHDSAYVPLARTVTAGSGLSGGGALSANITLSHADTSSQTTVSNSSTNLIQSVTLDTYGHVTELTSADIATLLDDRYVNVTGDTMSGSLTINAATQLILQSSGTDRASIVSGNNTLDINPLPSSSADMNVRLFRLTDTSGAKNLILLAGDNTATTVHQLSVTGTTIFNAQLSNIDFNIRGDTEAYLFYIDASADAVGFGTNTPTYKVDVTGSTRATVSVLTPTVTTVSGNLTITSAGGTVNVTGALTGSSTATFTTSVRSPVVTTVSGDLTLASANDILLDPVSNFVKLTSGIAMQSDNYAPQTTGLRLTHDGQIDARYLFVDEMHAKSFIADLEQALAGGQIISKSVAMLYSAFTAPAAGATATLTLRDLPSATGMAVFVNGDHIRIRTFARSGGSLTIGDCWGTVTLDTSYSASGFDSATKTQRYTFTRSANPNAGAMSAGTVVQPDSVILDYGTSGNGFYEVNAIDGAYGVNSPYAQVVTWTTHPRNQTIRTRMGNLYGIWLQSGEYGLYAGDGTANTNQYLRISNTGVKLNNIPMQLFNGSTQTVDLSATSGSLKLGTNVTSSTTTGFAFDGATGNVTIGNASYASTVTVYGQIVVQAGSSGYANISDKPTSLSGINSTEGTKLSGIENNATEGATWGINLNSVPTRFGDSPSSAGLYLTPTHMGYFNGSAWKAWISSSGGFYFGGSSGAHLEWNGTKLRGIGTDGTTEQWYAQSTDGKLYAGAGAIALDSTGLHVANSGASNGIILYRVNTFGDTYKAGRLWALSDLSPARVYLSAGRSTSDGDSTNFAGTLSLVAFNGSGSEAATITLAGSTGTVTVGGSLATGAVSVTGNITVSGTVDGVDVSAFKTAYDSHNHDSAYLALSGGTLTGTLTSRTVAPSANNTYDIGSSSNYYNAGYIRNLYIDTIVGTPSYSHNHAATDINSGTMAEARLPHTYTSALTLDADSAGTSNYLRWLTQTSTGKAWDLVARAHDYATTVSQQNDLLLTFFDGSVVNLVWQIDNTTRVMDFTSTPSVNGTSVSLSTHNHDAAYVPTSRTVSAGAGLTGGGALSGNISLGHADTSGVGDVANTNGTVLQGITFDTYGHVQTVASYNLDNRYYTESEIGTILTGYVPTSRTVTAGAGMTGGGALSADITISHLDTSSQATVTNSGTSFIQSVTLDTYGHITALASADIGTALDSRYVNVGGDTMTGTLTVSGGSLISTFSGSAGGAVVQGILDTETSFARVWMGHNAEWDGVGNLWNIDAIGSNDAAGFLIPNSSSSIMLVFHASTGSTARTMDHATFIAGEKFRFTNAGRLGILNNAPSHEVDATGSIRATVSLLTPTVTTASGNLTVTSAGGTINVTGALVGNSTASFTTSVTVPLVTVAAGDLTLNSAAGSVAINAATGQAVNLQVAGATQWAANETRLLPRSTVTVDIGDYNRRVRTLHAAELAVETLVAQNVMATIGGRITVAPTVKLIADLASTGTATTFNTALTSWWTLNEGSGSRADSRGSNNLTDTNTVASIAGKQANAANFTGSSSEKLNRSDNSSLSAGDVDFLFCAWIYPTLNNAARQTIINKGSTGTGEYRLEIDWTTSKIYWSVWNSGGTLTEVASTGTITTNTWYFVCAWHDSVGNVIGVSVNGVEATAAHSTGVRDSTGNFCLGARDTDRYYTGYIDEVGYWDAYLPSAHERRWLYNKGAGRVYADVNTQISSTMDVDSNSLASGDFVYMAAAPGGIAQVEALRVASSASAVTGGYRYTVVRNHDGSGINAWNTGDAVIDIGGAAGSGYIDLTSTSTIHSHLGPTIAVYQRTNLGVWNETAPTVALGNLRSFVDYASDAAGLAIGNDLTLTPATGFAGLTADATNGIRLFNTELKLYSGATEAVRVNSTVGLRFTTGAGAINTVSWYDSINGYNQSYIQGTLSGATSSLLIRAQAKDVSTGAFSGYADVILTNATTSSSIRLLAHDGSVNGPNLYMDVAHTGVVINRLGLSVSSTVGVPGLYVATPDGQTAGGLHVYSADNGSSYGPLIVINRNNNASTPAAGWIQLVARTGTPVALWVDNGGTLRLNTGANPTYANDTSGVIVGSQSSWIGLKEDIAPWTDAQSALDEVLATPLFSYKFKGDSRQYHGLVIDEPDRGVWFSENDAGNQIPALNERNLFGHLIASIKAQQAQIETLKAQLQELQKAST